ncbi:M61 family metallopeptidase [Fodinibius salsisoli]|uniref:M61 family metallopeptidase n=1 Tax=Fodinibius salsisoli TaxID=2820877 RepID=A0ABT3PM38_9BACT|nr:PDZ domain-containing protein [Fodinibius salsisoli]MCW9706930.1 M61 family metallopeptidase [Fodinibius salsisoli]
MRLKKVLPFICIIGFIINGCGTESDQQPALHYDVRFPNGVHNEAEITLAMTNLLPGKVNIAMSRTSPGRYALHEFAKNVYNVTATDSKGDTLTIARPDLHHWEVESHDGTIKFHYTLFGTRADGTYSGINEQHAHLNMPASFAWVPNLPNTPITVSFHPPEGSNWKAATQLQPTDDEMRFWAPNYQYFFDSPTELSDHMIAEWPAPADTANQTIGLAVHHNGTQQQVNTYAEMAQKVVAEQVAIYGTPADFDYNTYTFIADYLPYVYGDGMEHRNSTILTSQRSLEGDGALQNLYTLSHEFFHSWNVERIRPQSLEPFKFMEANVSGDLWFAEGFTSYYDDLTIRRAGLISDQKYAADWAGTLNYVLNSPGNSYYNPIEMSRQAPFVDAAASVDAQNKSNTFISYYSWGAVLGLGLDLSLRSTFEDVTLDDYMRRVWEKYGVKEEPYQITDLQETLAEVTDSTEFAEQFFANHIYRGQHVDLKSLFANAGFALQQADTSQPVLSFGTAKIDYRDGQAVVARQTQVGSPLYEAGLNKDDILISLDGEQITNAQILNKLLAKHKADDQLPVKYSSLGVEKEGIIRLAKNPALEVIPYEQLDDRSLTDEMKAFRQNWLGSKAGK